MHLLPALGGQSRLVRCNCFINALVYHYYSTKHAVTCGAMAITGVFHVSSSALATWRLLGTALRTSVTEECNAATEVCRTSYARTSHEQRCMSKHNRNTHALTVDDTSLPCRLAPRCAMQSCTRRDHTQATHHITGSTTQA